MFLILRKVTLSQRKELKAYFVLIIESSDVYMAFGRTPPIFKLRTCVVIVKGSKFGKPWIEGKCAFQCCRTIILWYVFWVVTKICWNYISWPIATCNPKILASIDQRLPVLYIHRTDFHLDRLSSQQFYHHHYLWGHHSKEVWSSLG